MEENVVAHARGGGHLFEAMKSGDEVGISVGRSEIVSFMLRNTQDMVGMLQNGFIAFQLARLHTQVDFMQKDLFTAGQQPVIFMLYIVCPDQGFFPGFHALNQGRGAVQSFKKNRKRIFQKHFWYGICTSTCYNVRIGMKQLFYSTFSGIVIHLKTQVIKFFGR